MSISVGDALLTLGVDKSDLDRGMQDAQKTVETSVKKMQSSLKLAGAAFLAAGVAALKMTSDAKQMGAQLGATGITIGKTESEMKKLALSIANVNFPLEDVISTFETLARAGVRNTALLLANSKAFDTLGDAVGMTAAETAGSLIPAFKALGETLPITSGEMDKFAWLVTNTGADLGDFSTVIQRLAPEMSGMGMTTRDAVVALAALNDKGITGRKATTELGNAIELAAKKGITLWEAMGLTKDQVEGYNQKIENAAGLTDKLSKQQETSKGIVDKLKETYKELALKVGSVLEPLEGVFALMTTLSPIALFLSTSLGTLTIAWIANTFAIIANRVALVGAFAQLILTNTALGLQALALYSVTKATMALNAVLAVSPYALIAAGLAMMGWGIYKLIQQSNDLKKAEQDRKILEEEVAKAQKGEENNAIALSKAILDGIKTRIASGKESEEELARLKESEKAWTAFIEKLKLVKKGYEDTKTKTEEQSQALKDLTTQIQDNYKAYQYSKTAAGELGLTIEDVTNALIKQGYLAEDIAKSLQIMGDAGTDVNAVMLAFGKTVEEVRSTLGESTAEMISDLKTLADEGKRRASETTRIQVAAIDTMMKSATAAYDERMSNLDKEYNAILKNIDAQLGIVLGGYQDQIDAINELTEDENLATERREEAIKLAELKAAVDSAKTRAGKAKAQKELDAYQTELNRKELLRRRDNEIDTIRQAMDAARAKAETDKTQAETEYQTNKGILEQEQTDLMVKLEKDKTALETALLEQLDIYDRDLAAYDNTIALKLKSLDQFLIDYQNKLNQLKGVTVPVTTVQQIIPPAATTPTPSTGTAGKVGTASPSHYRGPLLGFEHGGIIREPTLLYGLRSMRPYAVAGEAGIEHVGAGAGVSERQMGTTITNTFQIARLEVREEADVGRIARELERLSQSRRRQYGR